jgi:class 3 adenylate cyclase
MIRLRPDRRQIPGAPRRDTAAPAGGTRKIVAPLFANIEGSTDLMEDRNPEEAGAIVAAALELMIYAAHRHDGYVV